MDIMIIGMSIFAYLLIFNRCLTFKLTIMNNLIITAIMAFYMIVIDEITGALFVLPMFLTLICYIYWLKKEDVLWNIFLLLFSYMLVVIVDNVSHFFWKLAGIEPAEKQPGPAKYQDPHPGPAAGGGRPAPPDGACAEERNGPGAAETERAAGAAPPGAERKAGQTARAAGPAGGWTGRHEPAEGSGQRLRPGDG